MWRSRPAATARVRGGRPTSRGAGGLLAAPGRRFLDWLLVGVLASALALFLGYLWMLWEPRKRTWHDIVADSLVVRTTFYPPGEFARLAR